MIVTILADSINQQTGDRLTSYLLQGFPVSELQRLYQHSREVSINDAADLTPSRLLIAQVQEAPYTLQWTAQKSNAVSLELKRDSCRRANTEWLNGRDNAVDTAKRMVALNVSKQHVNRVLVPWAVTPVVLSATDWAKFFKLATRAYELRTFAAAMLEAMQASTPTALAPGEWHIPLAPHKFSHDDKLKTSVAMCARGSCAAFDKEPSLENDVQLYEQLLSSGDWLPFEHQAQAISERRRRANYVGFASYRYSLGF